MQLQPVMHRNGPGLVAAASTFLLLSSGQAQASSPKRTCGSEPRTVLTTEQTSEIDIELSTNVQALSVAGRSARSRRAESLLGSEDTSKHLQEYRLCLMMEGGKITFADYERMVNRIWSTDGHDEAEGAQARASASPALDVCLYANGRHVLPSNEVYSGDELAVEIKASKSGFFYVANVDPLGTAAYLFPYPGENNAVSENAMLRIPPSGGSMKLDSVVGTERLYIIWSAVPMAGPDDVLAVLRQDTVSPVSTEQVATLATGNGGAKGIYREQTVSNCTRVELTARGEVGFHTILLVHK